MKYHHAHRRHQNARQERFEERDDQHFAAGLFDHFLFKEFPHAEGDEGQGQITDKTQILDHIPGNHIQPAGPNQYACQNIAADFGKIQGVGQPGHNETGK